MRILLRLAGFGLTYKRYLVLALVSLGGANILALTIPLVIGASVDYVLREGQKETLIWLALLLFGLAVLRGIFSYGQQFFAEALSHRAAYNLRNQLLQKLQGLSFSFYDRRKTGDLMSLVTYDVESTRMFISFGLTRFFQLIIIILGVIPLLLITHWQLGLVAILAIPFTLYSSARVGKKLRIIWNSVQLKMAELTTVLQENLTGMRVVKSLGAEKFQKEIFHQHSLAVSEETFNAHKLRLENSAYLTFVYISVTGIILLLGGRWVINGELSPGELTQFLLFLGLMVMPVRMLGMAVNTFSRAMSSGQRIFDVIDFMSPVMDKRGARKLEKAKGTIDFEGVTFGYQAMSPALQKVDFHIDAGQKVAILGAAGSGKTTIVNLIPRFYDPTHGCVRIDGIDLKDLTLTSIRENVGMVFQDTFLFQTTLLNNIAYGANGVSRDEIVSAAKAAQLDEFIKGLPNGYETSVGERGVTLSGGQQQRLSIARTILLNPPILIMDDSTASVDVATESLIRKALKAVMEERTTFIIAHRVTSVKEADIILVLEEGEIVERGTHKELIEREGFYKKIYELQILPHEQMLLDGRKLGK